MVVNTKDNIKMDLDVARILKILIMTINKKEARRIINIVAMVWKISLMAIDMRDNMKMICELYVKKIN